MSLFRSSFFASCLALAIVFMGSGCAIDSSQWLSDASKPQEQAATTDRIPDLVWSPRGQGRDRASVAFSTSTASTIVLYRFSLAEHRFALRESTSTAAVSEWIKRLPEAVFVSNGMYFHEDQGPSGWFKTGRQVIGSRAFDDDKSALLMLQPSVAIIGPEDQGTARQQAWEAAQSFPLLIEDGRASVKTDSGKVSRRTFVGTDRSGTYFYVGIVPYAGISLYELSQALVRLPIDWKMALNVDGGPSSGVAFRASSDSELIDSYVTVPNVLVIETKN